MGNRVATTTSRATPALFICGVARSGTTLLLRLLDSHPDLAVLSDETYSYASLLEIRPWGILFRLSEYIPSARLGNSLAQFSMRAMPKKLQPNWGKTLHRYDAGATLPHSHKRLWVEKSPSNERFFSLIEGELGPRTRYIHVVRDPRDVIASWIMRRRPRESSRLALIRRVSRQWARSALSARKNYECAGERYRTLIFEELLTNPEKIMSGLADWLGISMQPILLIPTRNGEPQSINSSYQDEIAIGQISSQPIGRYSGVLTSAELRYIEQRLRAHMNTFGYSEILRDTGST